jgi:hypothetical protein
MAAGAGDTLANWRVESLLLFLIEMILVANRRQPRKRAVGEKKHNRSDNTV